MTQAPEELSKNHPNPQGFQILNYFVDSFKQALKNQDLWEAADIATQIRYFTDNDEGREEVMNSGVLKYIVKLLDPRYHSRERLMVLCSWIMCNMASGEGNCVKHVVDLGAIKKGIQLLKHPNHEVKQNTAWMLANIAGEDLKYRNIMLKEGVVKQVEWILKTCAPRPSLMKQVTWLMSNLLRGRPYPDFSEVVVLVEYIGYFLHNSKNTEILTNVLWCLSYITDGDDDQVQEIYSLDVCSKLISFVQRDNLNIQAPALRAIGNMLTITIDQNNPFIQNGIIKIYSELLHHKNRLVRKESCWGLSNIMAEDQAVVSMVFEFENSKVFKQLIELCSEDDEQVVKECLYCIRNACAVANAAELDALVELGVIEVLVSRLGSSKTEELKACLEALLGIVENFDSNPDYDNEKVVMKMSKQDDMEKIEKLQEHSDNEIYRMAARLIELLFEWSE